MKKTVVAIYKYENGLVFTGEITETREKAWAYLDEKYGQVIADKKYPCNHQAFFIKEITVIE